MGNAQPTFRSRPTIIDALWPPKPKLLLMATGTSRSRGLVGRVVQVAFGIGIVEIDRRRDDAVAHRQHRRRPTPRRRWRPSRWPNWLLVLEMLSLLGVLAEDRLDRHRFGLIAQRRAGAVGIDVADLARGEMRPSSKARSMALAAPVPFSSGCVMWPASALAP